jgi:hypothetical protein
MWLPLKIPLLFRLVNRPDQVVERAIPGHREKPGKIRA